MIDTLEMNRERAKRLDITDVLRNNSYNGGSATVDDGHFALLTMHRPSNVDDVLTLAPIVEFLCEQVTQDMPLIWPIHPRTLKNLEAFNLLKLILETKAVHLLHPLGYVEMLRLNIGARILLTDSGGLQEESCIIGTPCITLRWNTERPVTLCQYGGVNQLAGNNVERIREVYEEMKVRPKRPHAPPLWDGCTAKRIAKYLEKLKMG
jgi:UDP-N-acetylglucosamine 2-epimerase (non-hydrolysing)